MNIVLGNSIIADGTYGIHFGSIPKCSTDFKKLKYMICTIIILLMLVINLTIVAVKHGQIKDQLNFYAVKHGQIKDQLRYNFWIELIATIIVVLLYWGAGLFDKFQ